MTYRKVSDYKVCQKIEVSKCYQDILKYNAQLYWVPLGKNYTSIKTYSSHKVENNRPICYANLGNDAYNGLVRIYDNGMILQYRDGSIYPYIGYLAID